MRRISVDAEKLLDHIRLANQMRLIDLLRCLEGDSIEVLCDNPDGPPNNAVVCCGEWTNWTERRFSGETLMQALLAAARARTGTDLIFEK